MKNYENEKWKKDMEKSRSLKEVYAKHKNKIMHEKFYNGSNDSALLFNARAGSLPTKVRIQRIHNSHETICSLCEENVENINHIIMDCKALPDVAVYSSIEEANLIIADRLGFTHDAEQIRIAISRLNQWHALSRLNSPLVLCSPGVIP